MIYIDCEESKYNESELEETLDKMVVDWCSYDNLEEDLDILEQIDDNQLNDLEDY